jgi:ATP-dependent RNA helicase SUPV3L1/SUV3
VRVARLWEACGLPDFRKVGPEHHAKTVARIYRHLTEGTGHIPTNWFAAEIARLDEVGGDIPALGGRIAAARTWAYIAHRADWLADPKHWAARTEALEEKLSDALHKKLTDRFVDRRTTVLMREIGADPAMLDVAVADDGVVSVEDEPIGRLDGFAFTVDPSARVGERKRLLAAAERRLPKERARRAQALVDAPDKEFVLTAEPIGISWRGTTVARLVPGRALLEPRVIPDPAIGLLTATDRERVSQRVENWLTVTLQRYLSPLIAMATTGGDLFTPPRVRALLAPLAASGGSIERAAMDAPLNALDADDRRILRAAGLTVGTLDLFDARLLKPEPLRLIAALRAVRAKSMMPALPAPGTTVTDAPEPLPGFRKFGAKQVRIDLIERIARALHDLRKARLPFIPDPALATSFGVDARTFDHILRACGFRAESGGNWVWRSRPRAAPPKPAPQSPHFAALKGWANGV